jgi:Transglutaminase-like superfamily
VKNRLQGWFTATVVVLAGTDGGMETPVHADEPKGDATGIPLRTEGSAVRHVELRKRIESAPNRAMSRGGLAGAMGGVNVKVIASAPQEIILPIPQLTGGQVPVSLFVRCDPPNAVSEYRLVDREDGNVVLHARLIGKSQDVRIEWSSVVLLSNNAVTPNPEPPEAFRSATGCVQARSAEVKKLAEELWPTTGKPTEFAANIQRHVREMKRVAQPRSLDAVAILKSGMNGICTANANLAAALMRSKGIACRSMAVIPTNGMKLEMHRIVEFFDDGKWTAFDPSSLTADIPAKPWRNIVMTKTTTRDEETAMKPRMGVMVGCPYGQELELLTPGAMLFGQDFFWTTSKPLAEFDATEAAASDARAKWETFLKSGSIDQSSVDARTARTSEEFTELLKH